MSLPAYVDVDRRLAGTQQVRETLAARTLTTFEDNEELTRLHRIFYPVFRVDFSYETDEGQWLGTETRDGVTFLDGLWAGNDAAVSAYAERTDGFETVPTDAFDFGTADDGLGPSILMQFQVANDRAAALLPERVADWAEQRDAGRAGNADIFLRKFREEYGLPGDFDPAGFEGVGEITRAYLPLWLAEFRSDVADRSILVSFRDPEESESEMRRHGWLAKFVADDPTCLATFGYEVSMDRIQTELTRSDEGGETGASGDRAADELSGGPSDGGSVGRTPPDEREVIQPEGVELDASSLVQHRVERGFGDVGGMTELKDTLRHTVIRPLEDPETYAEYGIGVVNGVLLHGPPGCGKTYVAEALAGEVGHAFIEVRPSDLTSKYMGKPAQNVADLFAIARANQPCLLFLDEIDAIAGSRDGDANMNSSEQQMVNQLLTELEAVRDHDVVVMGATNLVEDVDPAIRRSGRFDERIEVPPPDAEARREIVRVHLAGRPTVDDADLESLVAETDGYAASDLELIAETAARMALRDGEPIDGDYLLAAARDVDTSIPSWEGHTETEAHVEQPRGVDLSARTLVEPHPDRTFDDVGGMADLETTLRETVIDPLSNPEAYGEYGLDVLDGLLLYGPPGCGKTYVAGALAGELGHAFVDVTPADLTSKWMGEPAQNVAGLFEIARANAPAVVFIDEIDAVAGSRTGGMNASEQQMVNQLLAELENVGEGVVVVAATNLIEDVDPAIRRSGRFDERVEVPPPDGDARRAILDVHLRDRPLADGIDWTPIVEGTAGYAASDLELVAENAARRAMRADAPIDGDHLRAAVEETVSSLRTWDERDRYAAAESGSDLRYLG